MCSGIILCSPRSSFGYCITIIFFTPPLTIQYIWSDYCSRVLHHVYMGKATTLLYPRARARCVVYRTKENSTLEYVPHNLADCSLGNVCCGKKFLKVGTSVVSLQPLSRALDFSHCIIQSTSHFSHLFFLISSFCIRPCSAMTVISSTSSTLSLIHPSDTAWSSIYNPDNPTQNIAKEAETPSSVYRGNLKGKRNETPAPLN